MINNIIYDGHLQVICLNIECKNNILENECIPIFVLRGSFFNSQTPKKGSNFIAHNKTTIHEHHFG
jgi:hypothetical protein